MTRRLALTPAIGLFTGLSMVSFGAVSMFLTGVHGTPLQATNACSTSATTAQAPAATHAGTAHTGDILHGSLWQAPADTQAPAGTQAPAATRPAVPYAPAAAHIMAARTIAFAARPWRSGSTTPAARAAQHPVLLDVAAQGLSAGLAAQHHSADTAAAATTTPPAPPTGSQGPVNPPPPTPDPSPGGGNVTPSPGTGGPSPGSTSNSTPGSQSAPTPPVSPGGSDKTPTTSPTPSKSATPTPSNTPTTTPPPAATLCVSVQTLGGSNTVKADSTVHFAIWVWLTSGNSGTAKIGVDASPSRVNPSFTVCQPAGGTTCSVSGLQAGNHVETQAKAFVAKAMGGRDITLTVTATSHQASNTASATDTIEVAKRAHSSPTPTPTSNAGDGGGYTPPSYPGGNAGYPGVTNPTGNLGSAFPQVSPSPNISPTTGRGHRQHQIAVTDLSAGLPLDVRLIGGQVIGLAILAAAVTIAVARLSLRRQPAKHSDEGSGS